MNVLVIDIGGTHVKVLATGQKAHREFDSGPSLTPKRMASKVRKTVADWKYDVVSIGYPGPVLRGRPVSEPWNLGKGWVGFNFEAAFKRPVKVVNDAAMQALGNYQRGKMLFLGLGTGLGSALIVDGIVERGEVVYGMTTGFGAFKDRVIPSMVEASQKPRDPLVYAVVASVILAVVIAASLIPARRATKVDPLTALRYE